MQASTVSILHTRLMYNALCGLRSVIVCVFLVSYPQVQISQMHFSSLGAVATLVLIEVDILIHFTFLNCFFFVS